ncbi:MAG: hypothetical protein N2554_10890 [Fimbriimonadales bacterium]|nr:hypothetical protein [Fimbriimonadales bacterium]
MARCLNCGVEMEQTQELYCSRCAAFAGGAATSPPSSGEGGDWMSKIVPTRNTPALVGYYLGVFSLIPCLGALLSPFAIGFGIAGLSKARNLPERIGFVHAVVAVVLGGFSLLAHLLCVGGSLVVPLFINS